MHSNKSFLIQRSANWFCRFQLHFFCQCWQGATKNQMELYNWITATVLLKLNFENVLSVHWTNLSPNKRIGINDHVNVRSYSFMSANNCYLWWLV